MGQVGHGDRYIVPLLWDDVPVPMSHCMKRPLVLFLSALVAGIMAAYVSNSYLFVISTIITVISLFTILPRKLCKNKYIFLAALLFYTAGAFELLYLSNLNNERFKEYEGEQAAVNGIICSEPDVRENRIKYIVKVEDITCRGRTEKPGGKILLTAMSANDSDCFYEYGRKIHIEGRIDIPKEKRNPGGFDYRLYLAQSGVSAMIFAKNNSITLGEIKTRSILTKAGIAVKNKIIHTINRSLPIQQAGLLNGMLIGYRGGLSKTVQQAFSDSGLMHIMAVSGANVAFIAMPLVFIFKKAKLKRKSANMIIIGILVFFLFITGFEPSVVRAVIMASVVLAGQIINREADIFTSLSFSAIILLLYNPYTLFNIGFQLSYAATLSLVLLSNNIKNIIKCRFIPDFAADVISVTTAAQAGVLPVSILYFNKVSVISIISNMLAVPAVGIITVLGSAMAVLGQVSIALSRLIGYVNCTLLSFILFITKFTSSLTFSTVRVSTPSLFLVILYYLALWFFLWYKPRHKIRIERKYYIAAAMLLLLVSCLYFIRPKGLEVVFIDVGEGDSAFIRTYKGRTVLIDGGGYNTKLVNETNIGDTVIIPFLLDYGASKLDLVVATHGHDDHIRGLIPVLKNFKVGCLIIPDSENTDEFTELLKICDEREITVKELKCEDIIKVDEHTCLSVLYPLESIRPVKMSLNNGSLVVKLSYKDTSIIFLGDIESEAEKLMMEAGLDLAADVMKVAHHGSDTSTMDEFIECVNPKAAVISVGNNNFGHPSEYVLNRLERRGIVLFRTDYNGAIMLKSNGKRLIFKKMIND